MKVSQLLNQDKSNPFFRGIPAQDQQQLWSLSHTQHRRSRRCARTL